MNRGSEFNRIVSVITAFCMILGVVLSTDAEWFRSYAAGVHTIAFNENGGTPKPSPSQTGADGKLTALPTVTRSGYSFIGWFTTLDSADGKEVTTSFIFDENDKKATIFARWVKNFTVTFNANGGTVSPASALTGADSKLTVPLPTPTRAGYKFLGWFTATSGGDKIPADKVYDKDTPVYAQWESVKVTFDTDGGSVVTPNPVTVGSNGRLTSLPTTSKKDAVFNGWFDTAKTGGTQITTSTVFNDDAKVYAQWTPIYDITFNANGGNAVSPASAKTGANGKLTSLPTPTNSGDSPFFKGWYTDATGGTRIELDKVYNDNTTIYAQWSKDAAKVSLTYYGGTPETVKELSVGANGRLTSLPTPSKTG
ncbi:MAG: InlB B-repeat-containing protein, partial [Oscillospiraceae bacterium]|nr:InlB B-repeat-containing protein [Oscillospiraceae bacterium]